MKKVLKWTGLVLGSLLVLVLVALAVIYVITNGRMNATYEVEPVALTIPPPDSALIARGAHIADIRACTECHGDNLAGVVMADDPALGRITSANLTSGKGGIASRYSDKDWVRSIRHGVGTDGKALLIMPSEEFIHIGREDLAALLAYIKQLPPVDNEIPEQKLGPIGRVILLSGGLLQAEEIDHTMPLRETPMAGVTVEYGHYLATTCLGCHGEDYTGGPVAGPPGTPPARNLTTLKDWSEADFFRAVQEGVRPTGDTLHVFMPRWTAMNDDEVKAIWTFLQSLEPMDNEFAQR
jgi:mono/diheme cytochrome c family protein